MFRQLEIFIERNTEEDNEKRLLSLLSQHRKVSADELINAIRYIRMWRSMTVNASQQCMDDDDYHYNDDDHDNSDDDDKDDNL